MANNFVHPEFIVETDWLADHLDDPKVRVLDCTTHLMPPTKGGAYDVVSGRADFDPRRPQALRCCGRRRARN